MIDLLGLIIKVMIARCILRIVDLSRGFDNFVLRSGSLFKSDPKGPFHISQRVIFPRPATASFVLDLGFCGPVFKVKSLLDLGLDI